MSSQAVPAHAELPPPTIEEVSKGIFAYVQLDGTWFLNNAVVILGDDGAVVFDTVGTEARAHAYRKAYDEVTDLPAQVLINSHSHGDHTHGNFAFAPQTAIVGHEKCREEIMAAGMSVRTLFPNTDFGDIPATPPFVTFTDKLTVFAGDLRIELMHVGPSHSASDVVAWIPDRKLLLTADIIFNGGTPFAIAGSIAGWRDTLIMLRGLGAEMVVPGHGPVCGPEEFNAVDDYLAWVQEIAREGFAKGTPPLELVTGLDLGRFSELTDPERTVANVHRAYSELRGEPRGAELDAEAFRDMITYNGGEPLRCLA